MMHVVDGHERVSANLQQQGEYSIVAVVFEQKSYQLKLTKMVPVCGLLLEKIVARCWM
jgi:hypothetical protein